MGVKILQPTGGPWWAFHGPATDLPYTLTVFDTQTGAVRTYAKPQGSLCGTADTGAFPADGILEQTARSVAVDGASDGARFVGEAAGGGGGFGSCTPSATAVCINGDRFKVEVLRGGVAQPAIELTPLSGVFSFANAQNPEVFAKVLGPVNGGEFWVYYGSLSNQDYTLRVTDTGVTPNRVATYVNPIGTYCGGADTGTF